MARRFTVCSIIAAAGFAALAVAPAYGGDTAPSFVIPSRPGIPVVINGLDASYAVVEGDWGLARPGHMAVTVIGGSLIRPNAVYEPRSRYIPRYGHAPPRGRNEAEPPGHAGTPAAESFSRDWSSSSEMSAPATIVDPTTYYRPDVVPYDYRRRRRP